MSTPVLRVTVAEAVGRKVVLWAGIVSLAFVVLFGLAFFFLYREMSSSEFQDALSNAIFGGVLTVLGLYVASFLASFLALTLASSSVTAEVDSGVTQAVAARPITRTSWYLQRWAGLCILSTGFVVILGGVLLIVAAVVADYRPVSAPKLLGLMVLQSVFLISAGMLVSTRLSAMATGVVTFSYFGLSWLGGFVTFIGALAQRDSLTTTGTVVSLLAPSDGIWKAASFFAAPHNINLAAYLVWVGVFTAVTVLLGCWSYHRRDL
ncbi:MAG: hypothetical protein CSB46_08395 [Micrococcales bacterium]|nr:MAG: hypothetical protein CSB46_08395 [Micrococcales bacterium]